MLHDATWTARALAVFTPAAMPRVSRFRRCAVLAVAALAAGALGLWGALAGLESSYEATMQAELAALESEGLGRATVMRERRGRDAVPALLHVAEAIGDTGGIDVDPSYNEQSFLNDPEAWKELASSSERLATHEADLAALLARFGRALPELDAALEAEEAFFQPDLSNGIPSFTWYVEERRVCDALCARIAHGVRVGRPADGWVDVERLAHVARAMDDQRFVLGLLSEVGKAGIVLGQIELLLARALPEPDRAERIARTLERLDHPRAQLALRGELELFLRGTRPEMVLQDLPEPKATGLLNLIPDHVRRWSRLPRPLRRLILLRDRSRAVPPHAEACRALGRPFPEAYTTVRALEPAPGPNWVSSPAAASPVFDASMLERLVRSDVELRARLRFARIALALASAKDIPEKTPLALEDPMAPGRPLGYRRVGQRKALLWSVGADGKDDGGARPAEGEKWYEREGLDLAVEVEVAPR